MIKTLKLRHLYRHARRRAKLSRAGCVIRPFTCLYMLALFGLSALCAAVLSAVWYFVTPAALAWLSAIFVPLTAILTVPALSPLRMAICLYAGTVMRRRSDIGLFVCCYTNRHFYRYAVRRGIGRIIRFFLWVGLTVVTAQTGLYVANWLITSGDIARAALVLGITLVFLCLIPVFLLFCSCDRFCMNAVFAASPQLSYRQVRALSHSAVRGNRFLVFRLYFRYFILFTLSLFCSGIPLLWLFPRFLCAKEGLAERLLDQ